MRGGGWVQKYIGHRIGKRRTDSDTVNFSLAEIRQFAETMKEKSPTRFRQTIPTASHYTSTART